MDNPNALLKTVHCKVVSMTKTKDGYHVLVVETTPSEYIPITIPFNFEFSLKKGVCGMLTYEEAIAGVTKWWSKEDEKFYTHNYTVYYFKNFLEDTSINKTDELYIE